MACVEQAVFTSAETDRSSGYQVVATSPGVSDGDARALSLWGPSHGSMIDPSPEGVSFNFHPLPSGAFCVSRTTSAGWEYSGRGGARIYTQCLILSADELARFANNPFAVLRAAMAGGALEVHRDVPRQLEPLILSGRSAAVDSTLLARLVSQPGPEWLATVVTAALGSELLAIAGSSATEHVIAGVINCLPPECRTEFSFSTGLTYSSRRSFRIVTAPNDPGERRRMTRQYHATVLDLSQSRPSEFAPIDGWGRFILAVLQSRRSSSLATQFAKRRFGLSSADLPALGLQLLEELDDAAIPRQPAAEEMAADAPAERVPPRDWLEGLQQAHAAHRRFLGGASLAAVDPRGTGAAPSQASPDTTEVLEQLESLDDLVFEAINGDRRALVELRTRWPKLHAELGDELLGESREQYLRHALSIWQDAVDSSGARDADRAMHALDVLCILFDEA